MDKTIAIVTGASGGLGREFVKLLSKEKKLSEIWVVARNAQKLQQLAEEFGTKIRPPGKPQFCFSSGCVGQDFSLT